MKTIQEIESEAEKLAFKKTYLRKNLKKFLDLLNELFRKNSPSDFKIEILLVNLEGSEILDEKRDIPYRAILVFNASSATYFSIILERCFDEWYEADCDWNDIIPIRKVIQNLPRAFKELLEKLKKLNEEYYNTITLLEKMLASIEKEDFHLRSI